MRRMSASINHPLKNYVITIDGPSSSGKGTLAKRLAKRLRAKYLDTGTIYRTATYLTLKNGIDVHDVPQVVPFVSDMDFDFRHVGKNEFEAFSGEESIEKFIRTPEVDANVHYIATQSAIRQALLERQTGFAEQWKDSYGVILDGRDTGARIYPQAIAKFFVVGDAKVRAERRFAQHCDMGKEIDFETVYQDMLYRDKKDAPNTIQTPDAFVLDVTKNDAVAIEQMALKVLAEKLPERFSEVA